MQLPPLLSAMRRNMVGVIVISIQTALTLAIMCNGLFIIHDYAEITRQPSGVDEADTFAMRNLWVGHPADLAARLQTDLAMLRSLPGVVDAYATNAYPLANNGTTDDLMLTKDQVSPTTQAALYYADDHTVQFARLVGGTRRQHDLDALAAHLGEDRGEGGLAVEVDREGGQEREP